MATSREKRRTMSKKAVKQIDICKPTVESPTWGHLQRMAEVVMSALGGPKGAADKLSWESFYTLTILASLNLDDAKSKAFIFGKQYLT